MIGAVEGAKLLLPSAANSLLPQAIQMGASAAFKQTTAMAGKQLISLAFEKTAVSFGQAMAKEALIDRADELSHLTFDYFKPKIQRVVE